MINPNKFVTPAAQEQGDSLWQGASTAQNFIDNRNNMLKIDLYLHLYLKKTDLV